MDASSITKLLQKQNTRYVNRSQTMDASTLIWKNQIQSSKYIKGVPTCDGIGNVPTNPGCKNEGICSFGGAGRTTAIQTGSSQQFLSVYSGADGNQIHSSDKILLQKAGKESCSVPGTSPAPENSYIVLPACYCSTNESSTINNQSNPYLPAFDTYYLMKNPPCNNKQDQNQTHFVKQCHTPFLEKNGVNDVFNPSLNVTTLDPVTKQFHTTNSNPVTPDGSILEPITPVPNPINWPALIIGDINSSSFSYSIADDGQRVFITGFFNGSINLYNGGVNTNEPPVIQLVTAITVYDAFVACYSNNGKILWATTIETRSGTVTQGFTITDDSTGIYVTGTYDGMNTERDIEFYNGISSGVLNPVSGTGVAYLSNTSNPLISQFVVKYNTSGVVQWVTKIENIFLLLQNPEFKGLAFSITTNGTNVYISSRFDTSTNIYNAGTVTNGSIGNGIESSDQYNTLLVQYDINGQFIWSTYLSSIDVTFGTSIVCDTNNVYMSLHSVNDTKYRNAYTDVVVGTVTIVTGCILISYDKDGNFKWVTKMYKYSLPDAQYISVPYSLSIDSTGLYIGIFVSDNTDINLIGKVDIYNGNTSDPTDIYSTITSKGLVLVKFNIDTAHVMWTQQVDGVGYFITGASISSNDGSNKGLYVISSNNIYDSSITLYETPGNSLDPSNPVTVPPSSILIKYDQSGNVLWYTLINTTLTDYSTFIVQSNDSSVYVSGIGVGNIDFYNTNGLNVPYRIGISMNPSSVNPFAFVTKYSTNGIVIL